MTHPSRRTCDICRNIVAIKRGLLYHTEKSYLTLRGDDPDYTSDAHTSRDKIHICNDCMMELRAEIVKRIKK